jgi:hypothetical protein
VIGNVIPENEKPVPEGVAELTVTAAVPVELRVIACVLAEFTATFPKARLLELMFKVGTEAFNCRAAFKEMPLALAVRVADCVVDTDAMAAEKLAELAPAGTTIEAGTVTDELLLARLTENPPLAAAAFSITVQASVPAPVMDEFAQESAAGTGRPVPLKLITDVPFGEELLLMVRAPVAAPAAEGSNCTIRFALWFGFSVMGKVAPEMEKPAPVSIAELTVTAAVPVELKVNDCMVGVFTVALPKAMLVALILKTGLLTAAVNR